MMKNILITSVALLSSLLIASTTHASGLTTNSDTGAGQVRVVDNGEVRYLGTDANAATSSATSAAQTRSGSSSSESNNPAAIFGFINPSELPKGFFTDIDSILTDFINLAFIVAVLLAFFYLIWAGFDWITSGGDKGKIDTARTKIFNAVIGIVVVAASYAILTLTLNFLGYDSLEAVFREFSENSTV